MSKPKEYILVINSGSATLKFKIFNQNDFSIAVSGVAEKIGLAGAFINILEHSSGRMIMKNYPDGLTDHVQALRAVFVHLIHWQPKLLAIGHRLVHGGKEYNQPIIITPSILEKLKSNNRLAPLHNPINLACVATCHEVLPSLKNIAVFDTGFYQTLPAKSFLYALPYNYYLEQGIRKYGFHGISHQFVVEQAALKIKKSLRKLKIISCHLGNGCSVTAVKYGQAVETSMGFTPLAGLMMGTRSGDIDPAIVLYLQSQLNLSPAELDKILNKKSGLLGISGYSSDLRDILLACGYKIPGYQAPKKFNKKDATMSKIALDMFIHSIVRYIGSYATIMGGVDYIIFTAGIGERNADVRRLVTKAVKKAFPQVKSLAIPTNEELMIARQVLRLIRH